LQNSGLCRIQVIHQKRLTKNWLFATLLPCPSLSVLKTPHLPITDVRIVSDLNVWNTKYFAFVDVLLILDPTPWSSTLIHPPSPPYDRKSLIDDLLMIQESLMPYSLNHSILYSFTLWFINLHEGETNDNWIKEWERVRKREMSVVYVQVGSSSLLARIRANSAASTPKAIPLLLITINIIGRLYLNNKK